MTSLSSDLKATLLKMKSKLVVLQWVGNLALILAVFLWLQIPDSHIWQFALSIISGLLIVLAALWLYAITVRELRGSTTPMLLRMLLLLLFAGLWLIMLYPIIWGRGKEMLLAGLWNSKLPPHLRNFFTYDRLLAWQEHFYDLAQWTLAGLLLPIALEISAFGVRLANLKRASRVWLRWFYWLCVVIAGFVATSLTRALAAWTPGKGVAEETISVLARMGVSYTSDILLWCFALALAAVYTEASEV